MRIGYARVSTTDQNLALQCDALTAAGCERILKDEGVCGSVVSRPGLDRALQALHEGDTLVVWKHDRLGRFLAHLVQTVVDLGERGVDFCSPSDPIDTTNAGGRLVLHIMGALTEFERSLIAERAKAGPEAAKRREVKLGRKPKLTPAPVAHARQSMDAGENGRTVACSFGVARSTLCDALRWQHDH
jgi:DNA invertase Pin-like site-specific DNA recombinase